MCCYFRVFKVILCWALWLDSNVALCPSVYSSWSCGVIVPSCLWDGLTPKTRYCYPRKVVNYTPGNTLPDPKRLVCSASQISHSFVSRYFNTLRTGDADLRFYITTVQDGWRKSAFLTCACFPCTIHLIMQYIEPVSEWSCWWMFIETWPHSELNFRHRASSI